MTQFFFIFLTNFRIVKSTDGKTGKIYYTIGEVARMFHVNTSLIRFWETEFELIRPHKNKKGNRLFTQRDVDNFHTIYYLVKEKGYTLKGAKEKMKQNQGQVEKDVEIIKTLENLRAFLLEIRKKLE